MRVMVVMRTVVSVVAILVAMFALWFGICYFGFDPTPPCKTMHQVGWRLEPIIPKSRLSAKSIPRPHPPRPPVPHHNKR